ncbi:MAG: FAD-binding oxidoreductase [Gemmatimonadota bacterium]|nr:FAD-binding oxidoreductase [Gemmatimonadota bacterium]MDH5282963.1 FAD-binding oxidoreductase [Gemmatimonadota bacterium]
MKAGVAAALAGALGPALLDGEAVAPRSVEEMAGAAALATEQGWQWKLSGRGTWVTDDPPADLELSTRRLTRVLSIAPADLVATVESGVTIAELGAALRPHRLWWPVDPPGRGERTVGSVVATATAGPLRHGYGPVRDQFLGCTVVVPDGRVVETGGRVVKNVAGFDLPKLHAGGFGAFGVIARLHLRLRAVPESDTTLLAEGDRPRLLAAADAARDSGVGLCALELLSPAAAGTSEWCLAARLAGTRTGTEGEAARLRVATGIAWHTLGHDHAMSFRDILATTAESGSSTFRLGCLTGDIATTLGLLEATAGAGATFAGMGTGQLRWSGDVAPAQLIALRRELAAREVPLTIERAPWALLRAAGHFGSLRNGVGPILARLRSLFDPAGSIVVALEGNHG